MLQQVVVLLCLFLSFAIGSKKYHLINIMRGILSIVLASLVLCFYPNSILSAPIREYIGAFDYDFIVEVLNDYVFGTALTIIDIISMAVILFSLLTIFAVIERVTEKLAEKKIDIVYIVKSFLFKRIELLHIFIKRTIFLEYCRLLNWLFIFHSHSFMAGICMILFILLQVY